MKKINCIHLILLLAISCLVYAEPRIVLFFKQEPLTDAEKIHEKLKKPGKIAKYTVKGMMQTSPIEGFIGIYGGYVSASDYNGELSFPRKHQKNIVDIIITPEVMPVPLFESTIHHLNRIAGLPATMYRCEFIHNDQKNEDYWQTSEIPLPEDLAIPLSAIVIIAKPKNIRMEIGKTSAHESGNFVLPNIFVKKGITTIDNSLYMLTIRHLFKPVETEENREPLKILTQIAD
jgi:hypothetical protein